MDPVMAERARLCCAAFSTVRFTWGPHRSLVSSRTPSIQTVGCGALVTPPPRSTPAAMLNFLGDRVRCMSLYLCGVKVAPWQSTHCLHPRWTCSRVRQLLYVELPTTRMLTSSTNPIPVTFPVLRVQKSTRSLLKNRNRIWETGEPCGMPVEIW